MYKPQFMSPLKHLTYLSDAFPSATKNKAVIRVIHFNRLPLYANLHDRCEQIL